MLVNRFVVGGGVVVFCFVLSLLRNPQNSEDDVITVEDGIWGSALISVLLASGFKQIAAKGLESFFLPCPVGTFTNSSSNGKQVCIACPPGILAVPLLGVRITRSGFRSNPSLTSSYTH